MGSYGRSVHVLTVNHSNALEYGPNVEYYGEGKIWDSYRCCWTDASSRTWLRVSGKLSPDFSKGGIFFTLKYFDCLTLEYEALFSPKRWKYLIPRHGIISRAISTTFKNFRIPCKTRYLATAQKMIGFLKSYNALCFLQSVLGKNVQENAYYVLNSEVHSDRQVFFSHSGFSTHEWVTVACVAGKGSTVALLILHQQLNKVKYA
jgi:hypothetical protein